MIYLQLLICFLQVGMFSIGGGYAAMPLIQSIVVEEKGWITMQEFLDLITIAEMTPGPITVNSATFVGIHIAGVPGAIVATFGCLLPSLFIVYLLAFIYYRYKNLSLLQSVLASLRPAVVALIASAGISILLEVLFAGEMIAVSNINWIGGCLFVIAFVLLRLKWNPILVMCLCGIGNLLLGIFLV